MALNYWKRAMRLGFLSWLLPFVFSFAAFPLKQASPALFDSAMALALVATAALLARRYFRGAEAPRIAEAALLGFVWLGINLAMDYPVFSFGPMKMTASRYYCEIGAGYLLYPVFLAGAAWVPR